MEDWPLRKLLRYWLAFQARRVKLSRVGGALIYGPRFLVTPEKSKERFFGRRRRKVFVTPSRDGKGCRGTHDAGIEG
jgi:hypothetical protein